jgi:hypothetical protein
MSFVYEQMKGAWNSGFCSGFLVGFFGGLLFLLAVACELPTAPRGPEGWCATEAEGCTGQVAPLTEAAALAWQLEGLRCIERDVLAGRLFPKREISFSSQLIPYERIQWEPCWFKVSGVCAAGWTNYPSFIRVSTMEPNRTGPVVAHETQHWAFAEMGLGTDPYHALHYCF